MDSDDDFLAEDRRQRGQSKVAGPVVVLDRDAAILGMPALDDIQVRDNLEPADDRRGHRRFDEQDVLKLAVDAVPNPQAVLLRVEMDVGGLAITGALEDLIDKLRQRGSDRLLLEVFPDVPVMLDPIR